MTMKAIDILIQIPCFKCLFADPVMESNLHCQPSTCEKLTEWLLLQVRLDAGKEDQTASLTITQTEAAACH